MAGVPPPRLGKQKGSFTVSLYRAGSQKEIGIPGRIKIGGGNGQAQKGIDAIVGKLFS
jgi:hypothetical protein